MNKLTTTLISMAVISAASGLAGTISFNSGLIPSTFSPSIQPGAYGQTHAQNSELYVESFNPNLGTLISVSYSLQYWSFAEYSILNNSGHQGSYSISWSLGRDVMNERNTLLEPGGFIREFYSPIHTQVVGPIAFHEVALGTTNHESDNYSNSPDGPLALYIGTHGAINLKFVLNPLGISSILGNANPSGSENLQPPVLYAAQLTINYTYEPYTQQAGVPEASTVSSAGIVALAVALTYFRRIGRP